MFAFEDCDTLTRIVLPASLKRLCRGAFENCTSLLEAQLPDGLEELQDDAFEYCRSLQKVTIPAQVRQIERAAFYYCQSLQEGSTAGGVERDRGGRICALLGAQTDRDPGGSGKSRRACVLGMLLSAEHCRFVGRYRDRRGCL